MTIQEAKNTLDSVIPAPGNKMVDGEHLQIAAAWQEVKKTLAELEAIKDGHDTIMAWRAQQIETIRQKIDAGTLTYEDRKLLDDLHLPHQYDKRVKDAEECEAQEYEVQRGDNLYGIAKNYFRDAWEGAKKIAKSNSITLTSPIYPGQILTIPKRRNTE